MAQRAQPQTAQNADSGVDLNTIIRSAAPSLAEKINEIAAQGTYDPHKLLLYSDEDIARVMSNPSPTDFQDFQKRAATITEKLNDALTRTRNPYAGQQRATIQSAYNAVQHLRGIFNENALTQMGRLGAGQEKLQEQLDNIKKASTLYNLLNGEKDDQGRVDALKAFIKVEKAAAQEQKPLPYAHNNLAANLTRELRTTFGALNPTEQAALRPYFDELLKTVARESAKVSTLVSTINSTLDSYERTPIADLFKAQKQAHDDYQTFKENFLIEVEKPATGFHLGRLKSLGLTVDKIYSFAMVNGKRELKVDIVAYKKALDDAQTTIEKFKAQGIDVAQCEDKLQQRQRQLQTNPTIVEDNLKDEFRQAVGAVQEVQRLHEGQVTNFDEKFNRQYEAWKKQVLGDKKSGFTENTPEWQLIQEFIETKCHFQAYCTLLRTNPSQWYRVSANGKPLDTGIEAIEASKKSRDSLLSNDQVLKAYEMQHGMQHQDVQNLTTGLKKFVQDAYDMLAQQGNDPHTRRQNYFREQGKQQDRAWEMLSDAKAKDGNLKRAREAGKSPLKSFLHAILFSKAALVLLAGTRAIGPVITTIIFISLLQTGFGMTGTFMTFGMNPGLAFNFLLAYVVLKNAEVSIKDVTHEWIRKQMIKWRVNAFNERTSNPIERLARRKADAAEIIETCKGVYAQLIEEIYADPKLARRKELALKELERMEMYYRKDKTPKGSKENRPYSIGHSRLMAVLRGWNGISEDERNAIREDTLYGCQPDPNVPYECELETQLKAIDDPTSIHYDGGGKVSSLVTKEKLAKKPWLIPFWALDLSNSQTQEENFNLTEIVLVAAAERLKEAMIQYTTQDYRLSPDTLQKFKDDVLKFFLEFKFGSTDAPNDAKQDSIARHVTHANDPLFYHFFWGAKQATA